MISDAIRYIGADDTDIDLFEGQYEVPNGVSYNSYVILDEKVAVMDTVDARKTTQWLENLALALGDRQPDYLVISHMEPDHAANIATAAMKYPGMTLVGNAKTFQMLKQFFAIDVAGRTLEVKEGDKLSLGTHELTFVMAPMVHWPEVMVTYESSEKVLFSADGFGKFGALGTDEEWTCEARRYYFNIVGKYGMQVQALLKKAAALDIQTICPLHGPVLRENLGFYLDKYKVWSSYEPEDKGVLVACASIYGNTKAAALTLVEKLEAAGETVEFTDLTRDDIAEAVEKAFRYDRTVICASTYDGGVFPPAEAFLAHLKSKGFQNRTVALMENGTWAPMAAKAMRTALEEMKNITIPETVVTIRSVMNDETKKQIDALVSELVK